MIDLNIIITVGIGAATLLILGLIKVHMMSKLYGEILFHLARFIFMVLTGLILVAPWIEDGLKTATDTSWIIEPVFVVILLFVMAVIWILCKKCQDRIAKKSRSAEQNIKTIYQEHYALYQETAKDTIDKIKVFVQQEVQRYVNATNQKIDNDIKKPVNDTVQFINKIAQRMSAIENTISTFHLNVKNLSEKISKSDTKQELATIHTELSNMVTTITVFTEMIKSVQQLQDKPISGFTNEPHTKKLLKFTAKYDLVLQRDKSGSESVIIVSTRHGIKCVMSVKILTIPDETNNHIKRISSKLCMPEITYAQKNNTYFMLCVINTTNNRMWFHSVAPSELNEWKGTSTPDILAENDEETFQRLESLNHDIITKIGGVA